MAILAGFTALAVVFYEPNSLYGVLYGSRLLHLSPGWISTILVISGWIGAAGFLAGGWLSDRYGRRRLSVGLLALSAVLGGLAFSGGVGIYASGYALGSLSTGMAGPMTAAWFSELFPTRARATSQTLSLGAGTIGGVLGLQVLARIAPSIGLGPALVLSASGLLIGALILLLLPETRGQPLPE
jgi:MFS family permease